MGIRKKSRRRDYEKVKSRMIGVMGTGRAAGVTHFCIMAANYLTSVRQRKTAVIEWNDSRDFAEISRICTGSEPGDSFEVLGVTYWPQGDAGVLAVCVEEGYEEIFIDFGETGSQIWEEWLRCQVKILVADLSEWKMKQAFETMGKGLSSKSGWIYLMVFGSEKIREEIRRQLGISLNRIPFSPDAFLLDYSLVKWFQGLL